MQRQRQEAIPRRYRALLHREIQTVRRANDDPLQVTACNTAGAEDHRCKTDREQRA